MIIQLSKYLSGQSTKWLVNVSFQLYSTYCIYFMLFMFCDVSYVKQRAQDKFLLGDN